MYLAGRPIADILVRGANWVGDALMTTPALGALRENFPQARLSVLAKPSAAPVYADHPAVDEVILYDRAGRHRGLAGLWRLTRELKAGRFDLAVLFQNAFEAALIARLAGIPLRLGYNTDGRGLLLKPSIRLQPDDKKVHETVYYNRFLARAGLKAPTDGPRPPVFHLSQAARTGADQVLERQGLTGSFLLGLAPGAAYGPAKKWPAERFARAADLILARTGGAALVFGGPNEAEDAARVVAAMSGPVVDLAGQTSLAEAAALIGRCSLFISNDSGLMHTAAAMGVPLVAVFGSTNPVTTSPVGGKSTLIRRPVDCSPCLKTHCDRPEHLCMNLIRPEDAAEAGLALLAEER